MSDLQTQMEIKVAIFEDHHPLRESLSQLIHHAQGFKLVGAFPNALNIEKTIEALQPEVILMDIQMPGLTGIDAVSIVRSKFPNVKVVMQTVFEDEDKIFKSLCAGANGYILKNTSPEKYLDAITEAYHGGAPLTAGIATKVLQLFRGMQKTIEPDGDLTEREKEILHYLVKGYGYKMIADQCGISYATVRFHMKNIYAKLHVASMTEAVAKVLKGNLLR